MQRSLIRLLSQHASSFRRNCFNDNDEKKKKGNDVTKKKTWEGFFKVKKKLFYYKMCMKLCIYLVYEVRQL